MNGEEELMRLPRVTVGGIQNELDKENPCGRLVEMSWWFSKPTLTLVISLLSRRDCYI